MCWQSIRALSLFKQCLDLPSRCARIFFSMAARNLAYILRGKNRNINFCGAIQQGKDRDGTLFTPEMEMFFATFIGHPPGQ